MEKEVFLAGYVYSFSDGMPLYSSVDAFGSFEEATQSIEDTGEEYWFDDIKGVVCGDDKIYDEDDEDGEYSVVEWDSCSEGWHIWSQTINI